MIRGEPQAVLSWWRIRVQIWHMFGKLELIGPKPSGTANVIPSSIVPKEMETPSSKVLARQGNAAMRHWPPSGFSVHFGLPSLAPRFPCFRRNEEKQVVSPEYYAPRRYCSNISIVYIRFTTIKVVRGWLTLFMAEKNMQWANVLFIYISGGGAQISKHGYIPFARIAFQLLQALPTSFGS